MTMRRMLDELEQEIFKAVSDTPVRRPWIAEERQEIVDIVRKCLGIRSEWTPGLSAECVRREDYEGFSVEFLRSESWESCFGAAHLWLPDRNEKVPLVILCCGHGQGGKQFGPYQLMAKRLALAGAAVLVPDNIGQGERTGMGHKNAIGPLQFGISLQGLIVMETLGWLDWVFDSGRFDSERIGTVGNSGGGTLTLFLGALAYKKLTAVSSSGYPSTFEFIARKEKKQCNCNIIPGILGQLEMWQIYGCFAPKPLYLLQGNCDNLFPEDIFDNVCRKVQNCYREAGVENVFKFDVFAGTHSWNEQRREAIAGFIEGIFSLDPFHGKEPGLPDVPGSCYDVWPENALTADELAARITGKKEKVMGCLDELCELIPGEEDVQFRRVGAKQLAAQMMFFLSSRRA